MKIVLAPDSFKDCLTAGEVCAALAEGILRACPGAEVVSVPMADGGEGTVQSLVDATHGRFLTTAVTDPLGDPVSARWGILGDEETAAIEMAAASGLTLIAPARRNPLLTSTFGTGELIRAALDAGCRTLIIGIGGSATNDGGTGMAQALGARFLDASGSAIPRMTGGELSRIACIEASGLDPRLRDARIRVACDVDNPLCGERGASAVYGPQKGATPEMVAELDAGLRHLADLWERDLGADVAEVPGAGAAGGLGAGLMAFCGATLERGVRIVTEAVGLRDKLHGADLCITGEGRLDAQTAFGKTPAGVAEVAAGLGVPVVAVAGSLTPEAWGLHAHGFAALVPILDAPMSLAEAMQPDNARRMLSRTGEMIARLVALRP